MKMTKILGLCVVLGSLSGCGYNSLQGLDEEVKQAFGEVQNQYQRRMDLVNQLVGTVKGASAHEKETLTAVIEARAKATAVTLKADDMTNPEQIKKFQEAQGSLSQALGRLMVVSEQYPDLKANANFQSLMAEIAGSENRVGVARKRYVDKVAEYNKAVRFFPTNLTAKYMLHMEPRASFEADASAQKAPEVKF